MIVKIFDVDQNTGAETFRAQCDLSDCFPDAGPSDEGYAEIGAALEDLKASGRHYCGGGAAPLVLLQRVQS